MFRGSPQGNVRFDLIRRVARRNAPNDQSTNTARQRASEPKALFPILPHHGPRFKKTVPKLPAHTHVTTPAKRRRPTSQRRGGSLSCSQEPIKVTASDSRGHHQTQYFVTITTEIWPNETTLVDIQQTIIPVPGFATLVRRRLYMALIPILCISRRTRCLPQCFKPRPPKKSRSTVSSPILACRAWITAS